MNRYPKFDDKSILIWGYGREGQSTQRFLNTCCSPRKVEIFEGKKEEIREEDYDYIIKSPGIVMAEDDPKVTSQTEIFLETFRKNVIGVTGTKGKSTTASLLYHVLSGCLDRKVILLGNIGEPCLNHFEEVDDDTVVVFEMSCHQLAHAKISPHIAVFLNLFEEHLDYYRTFDRYFAAKQNITLYQEETDFFYAGENVPAILTKAQTFVVDHAEDFGLKIPGAHNNLNAEFVFRIATQHFALDPLQVRERMKSFTGLAHRLQPVGEKNGVKYYDDSISTIPAATINALLALPEAKTVLIGGMDRGIDYRELIDFMKQHPEYIYLCMYESGKRIFEETKDLPNCYYEPDLEKAVEKAGEVTEKGKAVILSPAAASYGYFKNFEERGEKFAEYAGL